jgi:hypothetical protein
MHVLWATLANKAESTESWHLEQKLDTILKSSALSAVLKELKGSPSPPYL